MEESFPVTHVPAHMDIAFDDALREFDRQGFMFVRYYKGKAQNGSVSVWKIEATANEMFALGLKTGYKLKEKEQPAKYWLVTLASKSGSMNGSTMFRTLRTDKHPGTLDIEAQNEYIVYAVEISAEQFAL